MTSARIAATILFASALIFAVTRCGVAGVIVNENSAWPSSPALQTFERNDANITSERDARHTRDLTQTFQVPASLKIDKIFIDVEEAVANREFTLRLFTVPNVNAADPLIDPSNAAYVGTTLFSHVLTTSAGINPADFGNNPGLVLEFNLTGPDEVTLPPSVGTAGYALQILRTGEGSGRDGADPAGDSRAFKWHYNNQAATAASIYANGRGYALTGGGIDAGDDFLIAISAVPEPSAAVIGLLAAVAAMVISRRGSIS